ncbi:hypothetical protein [Mycobacterium sp. MOTT36Y]|uniref:hypothetical protein n=1 Tax=Mycobacterium sp. MOTT36Y TaxID=1168287 RepID=UPI001438CD69|nr:hypothetical protein [Mycobacterium sp. MOTT36Y]
MAARDDNRPEGNRQPDVLRVLESDVWALLKDRSPITKAERERALGYDAATGV